MYILWPICQEMLVLIMPIISIYIPLIFVFCILFLGTKEEKKIGSTLTKTNARIWPSKRRFCSYSKCLQRLKRTFDRPRQRTKARIYSLIHIQLPKTGSISGNFIGQWTLSNMFGEQYSGQLRAPFKRNKNEK